MVDRVPFSEAEEVWNSVMESIEARAAAEHTEPYGFVYDFFYLNVPEARRIMVKYTHAGGRGEIHGLMPDATFRYQGPGALVHDLVLSQRQAEVLSDFILLGAIVGLWVVDGVYAVDGRVTSIRRGHLIPRYEPITTGVSPMALLAATCGGALEAAWPERKQLMEAGWSAYQAAMAEQFAADGRTHVPIIESTDDIPDYLR
jgi:hypothetical protein